MTFQLQRTRGVFAIVGSGVDEFAHSALRNDLIKSAVVSPAPLPYHITLFTKDEVQALGKDKLAELKPDLRGVFAAGIGGLPNDGVFWVVVIWAAGQQTRKRCGLPPKDFHITLSAVDNHNVRKGISTLLPGQFPQPASEVLLDHLSLSLYLSNDPQLARDFSQQLISSFPESAKGFLRMADAALAVEDFKIAMLSYACAYQRTSEEKLKNYCFKKLADCSQGTEWGPVLQQHEVEAIGSMDDRVSLFLLEPWSKDLQSALADATFHPTMQLEARKALFVPTPLPSPNKPSFFKLPRWFRWLVPYHLAIMSTPRDKGDIDILARPHLGIRHVLTLTEETPLDEAWFRNRNITNTYLPIPNYHPPTIEQMDLIIRLFDNHKNLPLLVHCGGGKGRAGTVAACYLAAFGFNKPRYEQSQPEMTATDAIATLRSLRPGSLETTRQEAFVSTWCSTIWKRQSVYPDIPSEPPACEPVTQGQFMPTTHDLFVLVGLPGSGKSWFSQSLLARDPSHWTRISQDDAGSRASCETEIGHKPTQGKRVLLDRCNTAASDRKQWISLASNWCTSPICIWFDYDAALCESRAQMRADHPTLPPGNRVRNAIRQMQTLFVEPTLQEGFKAIVIIRSFQAANDLLLRLSSPVTIFKFPRTPHLINLGAASEDDLHTDLTALTTLADGCRLSITEKIDGANMGFSLNFDRKIIVQNRSHHVNSSTHEQFKKLGLWVERHEEDLLYVLNRDPYFPERYILFGEWLYATHSIPYSRLPDFFIAYDLYDRKAATFVSSDALRSLLAPTSINVVPSIPWEGGAPSKDELIRMIEGQSRFYDGRIEGVYVKVERDGVVVSRGKVVRSDFIAGNEHWSRGPLRLNQVSI